MLLLLAVTASAEIDPALLDRLDAPAWEERASAFAELLGQDGPTQEELAAAVPAPGERPEVRARLLEAIHHHFLRGLREEISGQPVVRDDEAGLLERAGRAALAGAAAGSLGVSHRAFPAGSLPGVEEPSIAVVRTLPGFPAFEALRAGDLIVGLNGRPVAWPEPAPLERGHRRQEQARQRLATEATAAATAFSEAVQRAGAGNPVTLRILRGGERLEVSVTLAEVDALRRLYPRGARGLRDEAWAERLGELGIASASER